MSNSKIFSDKYVDLYFNAQTHLVEEVWKAETYDMTDEEFKSFQAEKIAEVRHVMPKLFLCDTHNFLYVMIPEMQDWADEYLNSFWREIGLQKFAMLTSKSYIEQIALELIMIEKGDLGFEFRFFADKNEAREWLLS